MKKKIMVLTVAIMFFTGCGAKTDKETVVSSSEKQQEVSEQQEASPALTEARAFLEDLERDKVTPDEKNYEDVKKKYPEWFDEAGGIVYPVLPGSAEWKKATTSRGVNEACLIPEEIVNAVDTKTLLKAVEDYPLLYAYTNYDYYECGLQYLAETFYGMNVLLRREDACRAAAESYLSRKLKASDEESDDLQMREALLLEEFLFSREDAYFKFNEEERKEIVKAVEKNYDTELHLADVTLGYHFYDMVAYGDNPWQSEIA